MATRRRTTSPERRKRVWARQQAAVSGVGQSGSVIDLASGFSTEMGTTHLPVGITIGGILLDITATRLTAGTDPATSQLHMGIICIDNSTTAEVPRPLADPHADWMWWQQISFEAVTADETTSTWRTAGGPLRIRAKRKCEELGSHLWLVLEGYDVAPTFDVQTTSSVLMLLP